MSDIAIRVENLSKMYKIGASQARYQTLRESLMNGFSSSVERLKGNQPKEDNIIWALKDISFEVKHGEVLGIIGRNGAGKSTLLKILSRITRPSSGRFELNGRVGSLLEVGTGFHPELTGRENILLSGAILGMKRKEINRKFDEIVDFAEIEKFLDTPVKHYSSGMYMRLAFSVAAHLEPEILLVDEVLAVGDAEFQKKCLGKMGDVAGEGRTVLFVSHNMGAINQLCSRGILIERGILKLDSKILTIISEYSKSNRIINLQNFSIKSEEIILNSLNIYQKKTKDNNLFITDEPIFIQWKYEIKKETFGLRIGFDLVSLDGITIFRTFDDDYYGTLIKKTGKYKATCKIDGSLLKNTKYILYPRIGIHNSKWILFSDSGIEISLHNHAGVNSRYNDDRPGVIMPKLVWEIEKIDGFI